MGEGAANALDRWDEDGGAPAVQWHLTYETGDLLDRERRVLECLGAALVSEWNNDKAERLSGRRRADIPTRRTKA